MFAISFDMLIADLKANYGEPYHNAYYEISVVLEEFHFYRAQGSVYLSEHNDMANLFRAMSALKNIDWFKYPVRDIRAFRSRRLVKLHRFHERKLRRIDPFQRVVKLTKYKYDKRSIFKIELFQNTIPCISSCLGNNTMAKRV